MEQNKFYLKPFKQIFLKSDFKHNLIGIPFIKKYVPTIKFSHSELQFKRRHTIINNNLSQLYLYIIKKRKHLKAFTGHAFDSSIKASHQYNKDQNTQKYLCLMLSSNQP